MKIEKAYPAGWKMVTDDETYYFGEYGKFGCYCNEGVVYKDRRAFETGVGVCYINEYGFDNDDENKGRLFEFGAKEAVASELEGNSYVATTGYTRADLEVLCEGTGCDVEDLFDHLDWMSPETLAAEWIEDEEEQKALEEEIMHNELKTIVELVLKSVMGKKKEKIAKITESIDDHEDGILVYLSHGATLGESEEIQEVIKSAGLKIPEQIGNALIYVTK